MRFAAFIAIGVGIATAVVACGRSARQDKPVASLSGTPEAAGEFMRVHERWEQRRNTPEQILDFIRRFPNDGAVPTARVYLVFAYLTANDLAAADAALLGVQSLPQGATRDLATVAKARSLRLHNNSPAGLELLRPLVGKVVDDGDREMFLEELALTTIAAHDDYEALAYLDAWLRGVGEDDRDRVRTKIALILQALPRSVLEQTYRTMRERGAASGYTPDTQKLVAERLSHIAVETNDAALARWIVDVSGGSATQTGGDAGLELGELAASRRGLSIVSGKTVGILLPTRSQELRDEAADVVRGVSWALDLPRSAGAAEGVRLVTREDGADQAGTAAAMEELAGEGATVVLAGFDRASADRASQWSEQSGLPVLLLAAPSASRMPKTHAYVLGERTERELAMLAEALVRHGVKTAAFIVDTNEDEVAGRAAEASGLTLLPPTRCDVPLAEAGKSRFPVASWALSGASGWMVSGPASCARDVARDVKRFVAGRAASGERAFAVTLEAGLPPSEVPPGITALSASAGIVPIVATRPEEANDEDVKQFMERFGARPTYWTALGRDAGAIANEALKVLPKDATSDPKAVTQRRAIVQAGLSTVRLKLWTSDDKGIAADRTLPRALRLATWKGR